MQKRNIQNLALAAMFLCIGLVLPLLTSQIKEIGDTLLPMHIPVLLCGLICGAEYGFLVGIVMPFLRSLLFGMPPIYPNAVWMALELAAYGLVIGLLYLQFKHKNVWGIYISLITAMLAGRVVWGISKVILLGIQGKTWSFSLFIIGGFVDALPGIILQLILIPGIMSFVKKWRQ